MQILERPYNISFSLNDIRYVFQLDNLSRPGLQLQVKLLAKPLGGSFAEVYTWLLQPAPDGKVYLYVDDYINSTLSYVLPAFSTASMFTNADEQACIFTIHYREVSDGVATPDYITGEQSTYLHYAIKGGIEKSLHSRNNFFKYFEANKPFLTWQRSGRFIDTNEVAYLTFLNPNYNSDDLTQTFSFCYRITDVNGNVAVNSIAFSTTGLLVHLCIDITSLNLTLSIAELYTMEVGVVTTGNSASYNYTYYFDHRPRYKFYDMLLHNSISGVDFIRVRGDITESFDRTTSDAVGGKDVLDFFASYKAAEAMNAGITLQRKYKGDVGYLYSKQAQYALMELLASSNIYMRNPFRWVPVIALQKSQDLGTAKDSINSFPIEWALSESNEVFTPELALNVGDTSFLAPPPPAFCANVTGLSMQWSVDDEGNYTIYPVFTPVPGVLSYTAKLTNFDLNNVITEDFTIADSNVQSANEVSFSPLPAGSYSMSIITNCSYNSKSSGTSVDFVLSAPEPVACPIVTDYTLFVNSFGQLQLNVTMPAGSDVQNVIVELWQQGTSANTLVDTQTFTTAANTHAWTLATGKYFVKLKTICSDSESNIVTSNVVTVSEYTYRIYTELVNNQHTCNIYCTTEEGMRIAAPFNTIVYVTMQFSNMSDPVTQTVALQAGDITKEVTTISDIIMNAQIQDVVPPTSGPYTYIF